MEPIMIYLAACEDCNWSFAHRSQSAIAALVANHAKLHEGHDPFYKAAIDINQEAK